MYVYALQQQVDAKKARRERETRKRKQEDMVLERNVQNYYPYGGCVLKQDLFFHDLFPVIFA